MSGPSPLAPPPAAHFLPRDPFATGLQAEALTRQLLGLPLLHHLHPQTLFHGMLMKKALGKSLLGRKNEKERFITISKATCEVAWFADGTGADRGRTAEDLALGAFTACLLAGRGGVEGVDPFLKAKGILKITSCEVEGPTLTLNGTDPAGKEYSLVCNSTADEGAEAVATDISKAVVAALAEIEVKEGGEGGEASLEDVIKKAEALNLVDSEEAADKADKLRRLSVPMLAEDGSVPAAAAEENEENEE